MRGSIKNSWSVFVAAGTLLGGWVSANNEPSSASPAKSEMAEMMKQAEAAASPGPAHRALDPLVGDWDVEVKMWIEPGTPPTTTKGISKSAWTLQGRFVQEDFTGEFMGKPFHGISFTGYDNVRQTYRSVWIDDMSTTMVTGEGVADDAGKVITLKGDFACAMTGEKHHAVTQIHRILSPEKHVFEMHDPSRGSSSKMMEITYIRKQISELKK